MSRMLRREMEGNREVWLLLPSTHFQARQSDSGTPVFRYHGAKALRFDVRAKSLATSDTILGKIQEMTNDMHKLGRGKTNLGINR